MMARRPTPQRVAPRPLGTVDPQAETRQQLPSASDDDENVW